MIVRERTSLAGDSGRRASTPMSRFDTTGGAFTVRGEVMRAHAGRSVLRVTVDGRPHYLKRYWLAVSQVFQGHVSRGRHELRMIDWLNRYGSAGPRVAARGCSRVLTVTTRLFFLMEEVAGEMPLEQTWWKNPESGDGLLGALASFAAGLHDAGFHHTDFSERHVHVGRRGDDWTFRLIDLERAGVGRVDDRRAAADLKTLAASIADQRLRERIGSDFLDDYISKRRTLAPATDMRSLFARASATRSF